MKIRIRILFILLLAGGPVAAYEAPVFPFAPAAGLPGSTAVAHDDPVIRGWATGVDSLLYGEDVDEMWKVPEAALGPADAGVFDVLVLGRGGRVTLSFEPSIANGPGFDLAVFENGISDYFLELAFVEVSSDGIHFVRFPGYSYTAEPVPSFGTLDPTYIDGLAGKYRTGFGTPFDLQVLRDAYEAVLDGYTGFKGDYPDQLLENFPHLDLEQVRYVRLVDIPGDGTARDCEDEPVYDPYKTVASAGFDLDAVAVLNQAGLSFADWSASLALEPDPAADTDGDGWGQWLEYRMASDPNDRLSIPLAGVRAGPDGSLEVLYSVSRAARGPLELQVLDGGGQWTVPVQAASLESEEPSRLLYRVILPAISASTLMRFAGVPD